MPSTRVQKMIGLIIILIRLTKPVPSGFSSTAKSGNRKPTPMPSRTATMTAMYRKWVRSLRTGVGRGAVGLAMGTLLEAGGGCSE